MPRHDSGLKALLRLCLVQGIFPGLGGLEANAGAGFDFHRLTGLRVATSACSPLTDRPCAKTGNRDLTMLGQTLLDGLKDHVDRFFGRSLSGFEVGADGIDEFSLVHVG